MLLLKIYYLLLHRRKLVTALLRRSTLLCFRFRGLLFFVGVGVFTIGIFSVSSLLRDKMILPFN